MYPVIETTVLLSSQIRVLNNCVFSFRIEKYVQIMSKTKGSKGYKDYLNIFFNASV